MTAVGPRWGFMAMSNVLDETKQQQVIALGRLGWSLRRIEGATGVRRETVSGYLKAAGVAVRGRGGRPAQWPPPNPATTSEVSTDSVATVATAVSGPARTLSVCEPYRALIVEAIRRGRNAVAIWQELASQHGFAGRYASVRRDVRRVRGELTPEPSGIIETGPGEQAQVDYGEGPMVRDPSRSLDSFDFTLNKKMNRALVFELGTEAGRPDGRHARWHAQGSLRDAQRRLAAHCLRSRQAKTATGRRRKSA